MSQPRDEQGRFTGATDGPERDFRWSRFQTGPTTATRSPFDAGKPDNLCADAEKRSRTCVGPARRVVESERLLKAGLGRRIVRIEETQHPGRRDER